MFGRLRLRANDDARIAADAITANVMVADAALTITYMNRAVKQLLSEAEADIRKELPGFSVAKLIGSNIDAFHKNPSHQRQMLETLSSVYRASIKLGGRAFDLVVTPLAAVDGRRIRLRGRVVRCLAPAAKPGIRSTGGSDQPRSGGDRIQSRRDDHHGQ